MRKLLAALAFAAALPVLAAPADPEALIRKMTQEVLEAAASDPRLAAGDRARALRVAEEKIFPLIDFREATRIALGRTWWRATREQQERLVTEFRALLVHTLGAAQRYEGQTVRVLPVRMRAGDTEVTVQNQYIRPGGKPMRLDYHMHKTGEGWKIYDIAVEGVSLVLTYRSEFEELVKQVGIDGLIKRIADKNSPLKLSGS